MATVTRENGDLTPQEKKDVQAVIDHACTWKEKLENLAEDFDEKGSFGLMWDSKVPDKDKWFFYFFTFRSSNKDEVMAEIQKYLDFYREMSEIAKQMANSSEATSQGDRDACQLVKELRDHLMELRSAAETGGETTDSSTVCRLHSEFIDKHEKLEQLVKKVECVALKQSFERSMVFVENLKSVLEKSEDKVKVAVDSNNCLTTELKKEQNEKRDLKRVNDLMEEQNKQLLEKSNQQKEQLEALARANQELEQRLEAGQQHTREEIDQLRERLSNMSTNQAEELETLRREKRELEERNERLEQEGRDQSRAIQELSEQQQKLFEKNAMVWMELQKIHDERSGSSDPGI